MPLGSRNKCLQRSWNLTKKPTALQIHVFVQCVLSMCQDILYSRTPITSYCSAVMVGSAEETLFIIILFDKKVRCGCILKFFQNLEDTSACKTTARGAIFPARLVGRSGFDWVNISEEHSDLISLLFLSPGPCVRKQQEHKQECHNTLAFFVSLVIFLI